MIAGFGIEVEVSEAERTKPPLWRASYKARLTQLARISAALKAYLQEEVSDDVCVLDYSIESTEELGIIKLLGRERKRRVSKAEGS